MKSYDLATMLKAITYYGEKYQLDVAIEEMSELSKEICKHNRGNSNIDNLIEEMADVYIVLKELEIILSIKEEAIDNVIAYKMDRLKDRLKDVKRL